MDQVESRNSCLETPLGLFQPVVGEPSLAEAMATISADKALTASKRQHWLTSMNRIAEGIGRRRSRSPNA